MKFRAAIAAALTAGLAGIAAVPTAASAQARSADSDLAHGPQKLVDKAASVIAEMRRDPKVAPLLAHAQGAYIIPEYGRAGFIIGGKGGAGVVTVRTAHGWSAPAFFNTGGLSIGLQAGASGGAIVYLLMDRRAIDQFRNPNKFSFDAGAGLSIVKYSDALGASTNKGDAVEWTNMKGAFAGVTVGATDVHVDGDRTLSYYGRRVSVDALLAGQATAPGAGVLARAMSR